MVTVQQAVQSALDFAHRVLGVTGKGEWGAQVRLEEVDATISNSRDVWFITLSVPDPDASPILMHESLRRLYKTFTVDRESGEVLSVKIRQLASV